MSENIVLKEYYEMFDEFPYLLMTQSYESDDYQTLMIMAINRRKKLTPEEISKFFKNDYDLVNVNKDDDFDADREEDYEL